MLLTDERFYTEVLDTSRAGLEGIDERYRRGDLCGCQKQFADHLRATLRPDMYFRIPYYGRENAWAYSSEDDYAASERIIRGELMACGLAYQFPEGKIIWTANPSDNGYKEWTWQLSRHHEWRCLGRCYRETGDEKYTRAFMDFFESWYEQAPCPENEGSGATLCWRTIEAGIRMTKNWHYALHAFYKSPLMTDRFLCDFCKSVWEHGYRLSTKCSQANWLIMEMSGLSHIGMLYPFFRQADEWFDFAMKRMASEIDVQVYPDCFQYELSTGYHGTLIANFIWAMNTAKAMERKFPDYLMQGLSRLYGMYIKLMQPDGRTPDLNDGCRADCIGTMKAALGYFPDREDYRYIVSGGKEGKEPEYKSIALPYSGMAVMRTDWTRDAVWFFLESAPFGKGHQHEDKLNVLMFAYGKNVLPDTGNYAYDSSEMRKFALDTRSHNCAMVDDRSQNRRAGYRWQPEMISQLSDLRWSFKDNYDTAEGIYSEGYGSEHIDVTHKRKVIFFRRGLEGTLPFAAVIDRFISNDGAGHKIAISYQLGRQPISVKRRVVTADHGDGVTFSIVGPETPQVVMGQKKPYYLGWIPVHGAAGEHEHDPAPCVRFTREDVETLRYVTVLYPSNNGVCPISTVEASEDIGDTRLSFIINGRAVTVDEADYPADQVTEY